jgi:hypothetical protein
MPLEWLDWIGLDWDLGNYRLFSFLTHYPTLHKGREEGREDRGRRDSHIILAGWRWGNFLLVRSLH